MLCPQNISLCFVWFPQHSGCPLSLSLHHCSVHTFICTFLLQEGRTGETWEPSKINVLSKVWKQWVEKYCHLFSVFGKGRVCLVGGQWLPVPSTVMELRFVRRPGKWLSAFQEGQCCGLRVLHHSQASSYIESHRVCTGSGSSELSRAMSVELPSQSPSSLRAASCHSSVLSAVSSRPPVECAQSWYYCRTVRNRTCSR